jgi:hypothetical protein
VATSAIGFVTSSGGSRSSLKDGPDITSKSIWTEVIIGATTLSTLTAFPTGGKICHTCSTSQGGSSCSLATLALAIKIVFKCRKVLVTGFRRSETGSALLEGFVDRLETKVDKLLDSLRRAMATPNTGVLSTRCQTNEAIGHAAGIAFDSEFSVAGAENNPTSMVENIRGGSRRYEEKSVRCVKVSAW